MSSQLRIEVLFGEIANLFGELQNIHYLKACVPEAEIIYTGLSDQPAFVTESVDMIYMGAMTENQQELVIAALMPYRKEIEALIDKGVVFLFTGNAMEVLEAYIENEDGSRIEGLGIFSIYARRDMMHRFNSLMLGEYEGIRLVGFKSQFSHSFGENADCYFYDVIRGTGLYPGSMKEGLKRNHFFGTYTVGPFLVMNPLFVRYLLNLMGVQQPVLAYEDVIMAAYRQRLSEFETEGLRYE